MRKRRPCANNVCPKPAAMRMGKIHGMIEGAVRLRLAAAPAWLALAFFPSLFSFLPEPFSRLCPKNPRRESPPCFAKAVSLGFFTFRAPGLP